MNQDLMTCLANEEWMEICFPFLATSVTPFLTRIAGDNECKTVLLCMPSHFQLPPPSANGAGGSKGKSGI